PTMEIEEAAFERTLPVFEEVDVELRIRMIRLTSDVRAFALKLGDRSFQREMYEILNG
ncbi:unnamed protein product, partial [marine sediment metagenome]